MGDMAPSPRDHDTLNILITSTLALLNQFIASLSSTSEVSTAERIPNPPNPLRVVSDSAKLVKAHTTKLSLLAINKPFTPSAIAKVLKELASTCLPAMMSAVQICEQERKAWGETMAKELQASVRRVFRELTVLLEEIQAIAAGNTSAARRDSLSCTGVVWESCDALIELEKLGVGGLAVQKAEQYRDTIKDAIQELKEWAEGEDPESEGHDGLLDSDDEGVDGDRDSIEDIFNAANSMPKDRPELKELADEADGKLKKVFMLYNALLKRRLRTFQRSEQDGIEDTLSIAKLEALMLCLRRIPHQGDELVGCFYDLDEARSRQALAKCVSEARSASQAVESSWDGKEDEFTTWLRKWSSAVG